MRRRTWTALSGFAVLLVAAVACTPAHDGQSAACATPELQVEPSSATAGEQVRLTGENFLEGCPDASADALAANDAMIPNTAISIELVGPDAVIVVDVIDAEEDGTFEADIALPPEAGPGVVELTTDVPGTTPVQLVIGNS
ncbi:MAG TPA: hypothetical protein VK063_09885 [Beutenbergiaceae bacterium]|nr:hypothetical protein [Beutenbergiaceae bacterium]